MNKAKQIASKIGLGTLMVLFAIPWVCLAILGIIWGLIEAGFNAGYNSYKERLTTNE